MILVPVFIVSVGVISNKKMPYSGKLFLILFFCINILISSYLIRHYLNVTVVLRAVFCFYFVLLAVCFTLFLMINNILIVYNPHDEKLCKCSDYQECSLKFKKERGSVILKKFTVFLLIAAVIFPFFDTYINLLRACLFVG